MTIGEVRTRFVFSDRKVELKADEIIAHCTRPLLGKQLKEPVWYGLDYIISKTEDIEINLMQDPTFLIVVPEEEGVKIALAIYNDQRLTEMVMQDDYKTQVAWALDVLNDERLTYNNAMAAIDRAKEISL